MATDVHSREQRLRKQAELQSLSTNLANLRARESSYIEFSTAIPELLVGQIKEVRHKIEDVENELVALGDNTFETPARQAYRDAFAAESAGDYAKAVPLYKSAARHDHPDGNAALRSVRYAVKTAKSRPAGDGTWAPVPMGRSSTRLWIGLIVLLSIVLIVGFSLSGRLTSDSVPLVAKEPTTTPTLPTVVLIIPDTATPTLTNTPTPTLTPTFTDTPAPTPTEEVPTETPTPTATLRPPPKIIGPKDSLVWKDGTIVFEFEDFDLPYNQLYCLNSMKGFDKTNTENWSHPAVGRKNPAIPIEANVFRVAKQQDIRCIVWSASIGQDSCDNIISEDTEERVIGLPEMCDFGQ